MKGSHMTVLWNVYEFKLSHKDSFVITRIYAYLTGIYDGFKVNCGEVHGYLVMDLDYSEKVVMKVSMVKYLNNVLC